MHDYLFNVKLCSFKFSSSMFKYLNVFTKIPAEDMDNNSIFVTNPKIIQALSYAHIILSSLAKQ